MSNTITPIPEPDFLFLYRTSPSRFTPRHVRIRPYTLNNLVFVCPSKDFGDGRDEAVYFVRIADYDAGMGKGEGDCGVASVRRAI